MRTTDTKSLETTEFYQQMKENFNHIPAWISDSNMEFSFEKLLKTSYFKTQEIEDQDMLDWQKMTVFALYSCKQSNDQATYRKAKHIAR